MGVVAEITVTAPPDLQPTPEGHVTEGQGYTLTMPAIATDPMRVTNQDGHTFTWAPTELVFRDDAGQLDYVVGSAPASVTTKSKEARYRRTFPDADDVFVAQAEGVKHYTILKNLDRKPASYLGTAIEFGVSGLIGGVALPTGRHDSLEQWGFSFPRPFARDLAGAEVLGSYEVVDGEAGQQLFVWFPAAWFADPERVYPVTIDPTVTTSTLATATASPNQRHVDSFSNGVLLGVFVEGANLVIRYSADGGASPWQTPPVGATITPPAGFGSFAEPSLYICKDDNSIHIVATANTGRPQYIRGSVTDTSCTGYTWQASDQLSLTTNQVAPDIVAHTSPTGWTAHIVTGVGGGPYDVSYLKVTAPTSGTPTVTVSFIMTGKSLNNKPKPSIAKNDANTQFVATWSTDNTNAGNGVQARMGAFDGATMTWGAVEVVTGALIAGTNGMGPCAMDSQGRVWVVFNDSGTSNLLHVFRRPAGGGTWADMAVGAATASMPTLCMDLNTDTPYIFYRQPPSPYQAVWRKFDGTAWTSPVSIDSDVINACPTARRDASGSAVDVLYTKGSASPYTVAHYRLSLNQPPQEPTITLGTAAFAASTGTDITITHHDTDQMGAWALKRVCGTITEWWNNTTKAFDKTSEFFNAGSGTSVTIPAADNAGDWTTGNVYQHYAATKDSLGVAGPYNSTAVVANVGAAPTVTVTSPGTTNSGKYTAEITVDTPISATQWRVLDGATVMSDTGKVAGAAYMRTLDTPANNKLYTIEVTVWDQTSGGGVASAPTTLNVAASFTTPATPVPTVIPNPDQYPPYTEIQVLNPDNILAPNQADVETDVAALDAFAGGNNAGKTFAWDTAAFFRGAASARLSTTAAGSLQIYTKAGALTAVTPGQMYSGAVMAHRGSVGPLLARIEWKDAAGAAISQVEGLTVQAATLTWPQVSVQKVTAPAGAAFARLLLNADNCAASEGLWWDSAQLQAGPLTTWVAPGPKVTSNRIERRPKDSTDPWTALPGTAPANGSVRDYSGASKTLFEYRAVAIGDNQTETASTPATGRLDRECWWFIPISDPSQAIPFAFNREASWQHDRHFTEVETLGPDTVHFFGGKRRDVVNLTATYVDPEFASPHSGVSLDVEAWRQRFINLVGVKGYLLSPQGFAKKGILEPPQGQFVRDMLLNPITVSCRFVQKGEVP